VSRRYESTGRITPNLAAAVEAVRFQIGDVIRRAGGQDSTYVNVE